MTLKLCTKITNSSIELIDILDPSAKKRIDERGSGLLNVRRQKTNKLACKVNP